MNYNFKKIYELSISNNINDLGDEWIFFDYREMIDKVGKCICNKKIKNIYRYINKYTGHCIEVGSVCVTNFSLQEKTKTKTKSNINLNFIKMLCYERTEYEQILDSIEYSNEIKQSIIKDYIDNINNNDYEQVKKAIEILKYLMSGTYKNAAIKSKLSTLNIIKNTYEQEFEKQEIKKQQEIKRQQDIKKRDEEYKIQHKIMKQQRIKEDYDHVKADREREYEREQKQYIEGAESMNDPNKLDYYIDHIVDPEIKQKYVEKKLCLLKIGKQIFTNICIS